MGQIFWEIGVAIRLPPDTDLIIGKFLNVAFERS